MDYDSNGTINEGRQGSGFSSKLGFLTGMIVGVLVMAVLTGGVYAMYARQSRLGVMDPTTKIQEIYSILNRYSMFEFDMEHLLNSMYRGLIGGLGDNNAQYLDAASFAAFTQRIGGTFVGIGVQVMLDPEDGKVTVVTVFRGAPAEGAGMLVGDKITHVDGVDVHGFILQDVVGLITGREHTNVTLTIFRPYEDYIFDMEITRRRVEIPSVHFDEHEHEGVGIGYIQITTFDGATYRQFDEAVRTLTEAGVAGIVIDLRNNSGGLLNQVNRVTNRLIPEGVITFTENAAGERTYYNSDRYFLDIPMVVLVNARSASASEILSGAVQDKEVGTIVGVNTFGKGTVQRTFELSDGSAISITVQKYFTPNGTSIEGVGIIPDVYVEMSEELSRLVGRLDLEDDVQLQAAFYVIFGKVNE